MWEWCLMRRSVSQEDGDELAALTVSDLLPCHRLQHSKLAFPRQGLLRVLLVFPKDDSVCNMLAAAIDHVGYIKESAYTIEQSMEIFQSQPSLPQLVFIDTRCAWFKGDEICRTLRSVKRSHHVVFVAVCKKSVVDRGEKEFKTQLKCGFDRVLMEPLSTVQCVCELLQLAHSQVALHSLLAQNEAVYLALDKSRDLVLVTDHQHIVQYVNRTWCQVLGYKAEDLLNRSLYSFHQLGNMDQVTRQLEKGFDWEGKISWRSKSGENIALQCRAMPFQAVGREPTHYVYVQDNPMENHIYPRGSVPSIRKGSYDLKSINSEGAQSARRQSLAKLHNLPLEAPITRVISLICAAQENSTGQVVQILDKVVDILRTTELYSSHLKTDNLRCEDPVTSDLIGALITQGPVPASTTRRSSNDSAAVKGQSGLAGSKPSFAMNASPQLKELLDSSLLWDFNIFRLEELSGKRPLVFLGMNLLVHFDVHKTLGCDEKTLYNWLTVIERHYHATNTYHNSTHAADVLQATAGFLERERIKKLLDELDEACCLIAAAAHDIDHPGKSSAFLCNSGNELAVLYNDISVLESHHSALTFKLTLTDDHVNIFKGLERDTYKVARQSIIDMILATEMTKHFEHLAKFVSVFNKPASASDDASGDAKSPSDCGGDFASTTSTDEVNLVKRMMIKCADVSNPTRPLKMCVEWARRIAEEYFTQTDEEKANHLPVVMPMFDRQTCSIPKSQMGFVDFIINDMFEAWDAFIDMPEMLYHLRSNYQYWKDLEEKGITSLGDISLKQSSSSSPNSNLPNIPEKNSNSY